jgi:hypothetical protein
VTKLIAVDEADLVELVQKARSGMITPESLGADLDAIRRQAKPIASAEKIEQLRGLVRIKQHALVCYGRCTCPMNPKKDSVRCGYCIARAAGEKP